MTLDAVRQVADAVLYEGYLLYPYRASAAKNRSRWQFGVLGPPHAGPAAYAEEPEMVMQCLLGGPGATVTVHLRFLQLQVRQVQRRDGDDWRRVPSLATPDGTLLSWDEAVEHEITLPPVPVAGPPTTFGVAMPGGEDVEPVPGGRIVRRRWPLTGSVRVDAEPDGDLRRLTVTVRNEHPGAADGPDAAIRSSLIGAHVLLHAYPGGFVSLLDPPPGAAGAAARCRQRRCWPVLAGPPGSHDVLLGAPIILYDHPQIAEQSPGALYDSTEIDEILTLRVMTMTDAEKAEARATDPRARAIVDRCDTLTPDDLQHLHGILRTPDTGPGGAPGVPWWDPAADTSVRPDTDAVVVDGVPVARDSLVRVHPRRRADAQDLFFADQVARVTAVLHDVDGDVHVAVVLVDDPAADLHDSYGRYLYFAPDELEPLPHRKDARR
jgi:hypothetical protein